MRPGIAHWSPGTRRWQISYCDVPCRSPQARGAKCTSTAPTFKFMETVKKVTNRWYKEIPNPLSEVLEFLRESNAIEGIYSAEALEDAGKAWGFLIDQLNIGEHMAPEAIILKTHELLGTRIMPAIAGKLRDCAVYIGGHEAPKHYAVSVLLDEWIKRYWHAETWSKIKKAHIAFEHIHPFQDINGRTGRLLMNYQRVCAGLPILVIHTGKEQFAYYQWFKKNARN